MPIRRRLDKQQKATYHRQYGFFSDGPPRGIPGVALPSAPRFTMNLPAPLKNKFVLIGERVNHHWPRIIERHSHWETYRPTSGYVGFTTWLTEHLVYREPLNASTHAFYQWNPDSGKAEQIATFYDFNVCGKTRIDGEIKFEYHRSYFAEQEEEEAYWQNTDAWEGWPNWLHALEKKSHDSMLTAAEHKFGLKKKWGKRK